LAQGYEDREHLHVVGTAHLDGSAIGFSEAPLLEPDVLGPSEYALLPRSEETSANPVDLLHGLRRRAMRVSEKETSFSVRGFHQGSASARRLLETHCTSFVQGFNAALIAPDEHDFATRALIVPLEEQGFAYEGAGMALGLLDLLTPFGGRRVQRLLSGPGAAHASMIHVGLGRAFARLHRHPWGAFKGMDLRLRWLVLDGYGFQEAFFKPERFVRACQRPHRLTGYGLRAFDQGIGRCLWFVEGADVERVAAAVRGFDASRLADLWSGVGFAACYAGGVGRPELELLVVLSGEAYPALAQGAAFAAKARERARNVAPHNELGCEAICGMEVEKAAGFTDGALWLASLATEHRTPQAAYEMWRCVLQAYWSRESSQVGDQW